MNCCTYYISIRRRSLYWGATHFQLPSVWPSDCNPPKFQELQLCSSQQSCWFSCFLSVDKKQSQWASVVTSKYMYIYRTWVLNMWRFCTDYCFTLLIHILFFHVHLLKCQSSSSKLQVCSQGPRPPQMPKRHSWLAHWPLTVLYQRDYISACNVYVLLLFYFIL